MAVYDNILKKIHEYNRNNSTAASDVVRDGEKFESIIMDELLNLEIPFSGEEGLGKYLDLHEFYNVFINSKFGYPLDYTDYIDYIEGVFEYLVGFLDRTEPLMLLDRVFKNLEAEFENQWKKRPRTTTIYDVIENFDECNTVESLIELGSVKLRECLEVLGLKSGGTVLQKAARVFLAKNTPVNKLERKHFKKRTEDKATVLLEVKVKKLCEILKETLDRTRQHVKNRLAMTAKELADDDREADDVLDLEEIDGEEDDDDDNKVVNVNKKLSMPYWLYKFHGLDQEFKCQICGDCTYKGRRSFENHFWEKQHEYGMRCLGIPNSKMFYEITEIDEAKELWESIRLREGLTQWCPETDEECEDGDGNIYTKKTYMDLVRQGLI
ncbi:splicing factor SF3a60 homolog [Spinacia oleracea]|uniref:Splicing factor SF3a60 homolog n=1 Tax=Spinacia oleracea TaxID=3562 RepID=A0A9R0JNE9_SPIOL|nr:splicing factor SF3a60 homolog [Spinacia oleracea]